MKNTLTQRIVLGMLVLFLLGYAGYQAWRYFTVQYKTETVYTYTVSENTAVTGIVLRNEDLISQWVGDGVAAYLVSDGTKVSGGMAIAEIYQSREDADVIRRLRELEHRRTQLIKAQDPGTTSFAHADVLNRQIFSELGNVINEVDNVSFNELSESADQLLLLMNTKQIATGKQADFNSAIDRLEAEEAYLTAQVPKEPSTIKAARPGYFIRTIDGYEGKADIKNLDRLTPEELSKLISSSPNHISARVGKLMISPDWYYAIAVTDEETEKYRKGAAVELDFHLNGTSPVPAVIQSVTTDKEKGGAVVIFRSNYVNEALVNLRLAQADVNFKSVSGLRVSSSAIRFDGIQKGVYILRGENLEFRPIEVLHEDVGFVICREVDVNAANFAQSLQQYDDVVIEGAELYDGKPAK